MSKMQLLDVGHGAGNCARMRHSCLIQRSGTHKQSVHCYASHQLWPQFSVSTLTCTYVQYRSSHIARTVKVQSQRVLNFFLIPPFHRKAYTISPSRHSYLYVQTNPPLPPPITITGYGRTCSGRLPSLSTNGRNAPAPKEIPKAPHAGRPPPWLTGTSVMCFTKGRPT